MASPKGQYTPKSGPFAGQSFPTYFRYQQARAQNLGFSSYSEQRAIMGLSLVQALRDRAVESGAMTPSEATREVSAWYRSQDYKGKSARAGDANHSLSQGIRKRAAIRWAVENGLYDYGDDAIDEIPY